MYDARLRFDIGFVRGLRYLGIEIKAPLATDSSLEILPVRSNNEPFNYSIVLVSNRTAEIGRCRKDNPTSEWTLSLPCVNKPDNFPAVGGSPAWDSLVEWQ